MFNHDFFISHPQKKLPTAHAKKRNNFKMASQLKLIKFHTHAKKLQLQPVWLFMQQTLHVGNPPASSQWRETVRLFMVQLLLHRSWHS